MKKVKESKYNIWIKKDKVFHVYNGISGKVTSISRKDYNALRQFLNNQKEENRPLELISQMAHNLMLFEDDFDEVDLLESLYSKSRWDTSSFSLVLVTSLGCNFDCPYCFEAKHPSIMTKEVQKRVIQILDDQLPKIKKFKVRWFGGEPLLGKKALFSLSDVFIERCIKAKVDYEADIVTNGYLLNEETCKQLQERQVTSAIVTLDGPPEIHNQMRPLSSGKGSFWQIIKNLHQAVKYLRVNIRVNINLENFHYVESLMQILNSEGLSGKINIYPGQITNQDFGVSSPSSTYEKRCFTNAEFARAELEFVSLALQYELTQPTLPTFVATPCTAVRFNELVIGSKGELYKCYESIGNKFEEIGNIKDYKNFNGRLQRWLKYDPFTNNECRSCIALPGCMGGCSHHAMNQKLYENRCGTFRHTYKEQIERYIEDRERTNISVPVKIQRNVRNKT